MKNRKSVKNIFSAVLIKNSNILQNMILKNNNNKLIRMNKCKCKVAISRLKEKVENQNSKNKS